MSETMVETCVLTLGELMSGKVANEKIEKCKEVAQYFNDKKYQLTIPFYQRTYVWSENMVKIMLEDIDEQREENEIIKKHNETNLQDKKDKKRYLLGSLIVHIEIDEKKQDDNGSKENNGKQIKFNIVDGQQRLTTLDLVLNDLGDKLDLEKERKISSENDTEQTIKQTIKNWFESRDRQSFLDYLKKSIEFVCVFTNSIDDAFIFFDSVNAKGMRLKSYDLTKAFHLRALETQNCEDLIKFYAKDFESFAKKSDNDNDDRDDENRPIKVLLNDILAPARIWLRDRGKLANATHKVITNPQEHYIYDEFCKEFSATLQTKPQRSINSLGILQNFIGGADFFEYLAHFNRLYEKLLQTEFYDKKIASIDETGFAYNRLIYIMAILIYFDKFPNGNADYMLRLIARAIFSLRVAESRIGEATIKKYAKEQKILSLTYHTSTEQELESELLKFILDRISIEDKNKDNITNATKLYLKQVQGFDNNKNEKKIPYEKTEYGRYNITPHLELTK